MAHSTKKITETVEKEQDIVSESPADLLDRIQRELEAIRLVELGARTNLVCQLTDVDKRVVSRLHRQLTGSPSSSGLTPFTDAWYIKDNRIMLHAGVIWKLYRQTDVFGHTPARQLIAVYQAYTSLVKTPLLDISRAYFVIRLVAMDIWHERKCPHCQADYLAPVDRLILPCYGCTLFFDHRCRHCNAKLPRQLKGRPRKHCQHCGLVR